MKINWNLKMLKRLSTELKLEFKAKIWATSCIMFIVMHKDLSHTHTYTQARKVNEDFLKSAPKKNQIEVIIP